MFQPKNEQKFSTTKTIILAAECLHGFLLAGRFAEKFLLDDRTRIILLNAFKEPMAAASRFRNFDLLLKQNAEEDLSLVKSTLIKDYGLASGKIDKVTIKGKLDLAVGRNFDELENLSIVLGFDFNIADRKDTYIAILSSLLNSINRPIFIISDFVAVMESSRVVVISDEMNAIPPVFLNSLRKALKNFEVELEIVTSDNGNAIEMNKDTAAHFSGNMNILEFDTQILNIPSARL